jgi:dihydropteroate synthase
MKSYVNFFGKSSKRQLDFKTPMIMGVLNVTPDSFYSRSRVETSQVVDRAGEMLEVGADIIDIGGMSSRPGAFEVPVEAELDRLIPALEDLRSAYPTAVISIDTYRSEVVIAADQVGIDIVNDISAGTKDPQMYATVAELKLIYILMHMKGSPQTMQDDTHYDDIILDTMRYMSEMIAKAKEHHLHDIIIDPGVGFGKAIGDNYNILKRLESYKIFDLPILVGLSRKSFIYKQLGTDADQALNGTTAMHMLALLNGANILRVHDVKEAVEVANLYQAYRTA